MECLFIQNNLHLWVNIIFFITAVGAFCPYLKWRKLYTPAVKHKHLTLMLCGVIPFLVTAWAGVSNVGYTKEFLSASLYFSGFSSILLRQYALTFLQDLPNMPKYPYSEYQIQCLKTIKKRRLSFVIIALYLFFTGTLILLYVKDIEYTIQEVISQNRDMLSNISSLSKKRIEGVIDGVTYVVGFTRGRIGQFYIKE